MLCKILFAVFFQKNPYLEKIQFLRYGPKCAWPIRLQDFKSTIAPEQNLEKVWFFACWYKFMKIKSWLKSSVVDGVRNDCVYSGHRTLKLAVSRGYESDFWWVDTNSWKHVLKTCGHSGCSDYKECVSRMYHQRILIRKVLCMWTLRLWRNSTGSWTSLKVTEHILGGKFKFWGKSLKV